MKNVVPPSEKLLKKKPASSDKYHDMGLSENVGYIPNYSHFIGIMIINHWV